MVCRQYFVGRLGCGGLSAEGVDRGGWCAVSVMILSSVQSVFADIVTAQRGSGSSATATTSHAITLPTTSQVTGELYLIFFNPGAAATCSTSSSGWTLVGQVGTATASPIAVFAGIVGTAGALTVTTSASVARAYTTYRLTNWSGNLAEIQVIGGGNASSSSTHTCPTLTPTLGSLKYLWFAVDCPLNGSSSYNPSAVPSGSSFTNFTAVTSATTGSATEATVNSCERLVLASTESPGNFTATFGVAYSTAVIAVPPGH